MALPSNIVSMSDADVKRLTERVAPLIPVVAERIHYAESRIAGINLQSTVFLAAGAAALTAAFAFDKLSLRVPIMVSGAYLFGFGLVMLFMASRQVNRYPWTSATKTWKWFYRDALKDQKAFEFPIRQYIGNWSELGKAVRAQFTSQLNDFESLATTTMLDDRENLWQDIQQIYVLHVNEKYKNLFLTHLRKVFGLLSIGFVIALAFGVYIGQRAEDWAQSPNSRGLTMDGVKVTFQWRLANDTTENHVDTATVLIDVSVIDNSPNALTISGIRLKDRYGMEIPFTTVSAAPAALVIKSHGSGTYSSVVQFPMSLYSSMDRVETIDGK